MRLLHDFEGTVFACPHDQTRGQFDVAYLQFFQSKFFFLTATHEVHDLQSIGSLQTVEAPILLFQNLTVELHRNRSPVTYYFLEQILDGPLPGDGSSFPVDDDLNFGVGHFRESPILPEKTVSEVATVYARFGCPDLIQSLFGYSTGVGIGSDKRLPSPSLGLALVRPFR